MVTQFIGHIFLVSCINLFVALAASMALNSATLMLHADASEQDSRT